MPPVELDFDKMKQKVNEKYTKQEEKMKEVAEGIKIERDNMLTDFEVMNKNLRSSSMISYFLLIFFSNSMILFFKF